MTNARQVEKYKTLLQTWVIKYLISMHTSQLIHAHMDKGSLITATDHTCTHINILIHMHPYTQTTQMNKNA